MLLATAECPFSGILTSKSAPTPTVVFSWFANVLRAIAGTTFSTFRKCCKPDSFYIFDIFWPAIVHLQFCLAPTRWAFFLRFFWLSLEHICYHWRNYDCGKTMENKDAMKPRNNPNWLRKCCNLKASTQDYVHKYDPKILELKRVENTLKKHAPEQLPSTSALCLSALPLF